jgi:hypothetical protein
MSQNVLNTLRIRDSIAYYEGNLASFPRLMVGRLTLNSKYLAFHIYDVYQGGVLQGSRLIPTGKVLAIPMGKIVDVSIERGVRSRRSRPNWRDKNDFQRKVAGERQLNIPPGVLEGSENYTQLMITMETENGVEIVIFEVENPQGWEQALRSQLTKVKA